MGANIFHNIYCMIFSFFPPICQFCQFYYLRKIKPYTKYDGVVYNENNDLAERWNSIAIGQIANANITYKGQLGRRQINR